MVILSNLASLIMLWMIGAMVVDDVIDRDRRDFYGICAVLALTVLAIIATQLHTWRQTAKWPAWAVFLSGASAVGVLYLILWVLVSMALGECWDNACSYDR
ncbi:MAG: hypothetical protein WAP35_05045 [Solirubrobacterales bacterium]